MKPHFLLPFAGALPLFAGAGCGGGTSSQRPAATPAPVASTSVVFVSTRAGAPEIYRMNPDGSAQTRLTTGIANADNPSQSRDGRIVFQSNRDGNLEIYRINRDGSDLTRLTNDSGAVSVADFQPAFSPDGKTIAWASNRGGTSQIWLMDASGANQRQFTTEPISADNPAWTPDSVRLGYFSDTGTGLRDSQRLLKINSTVTGQTTFTAKDTAVSPEHLRFNPNATQAVFAGGVFGLLNLRIFDLASQQSKSGPSIPPENISINRAPNFSPDGREIVWDASQRFDVTNPRPIAQIYRANVDGSNRVALTDQGSNFSPDY